MDTLITLLIRWVQNNNIPTRDLILSCFKQIAADPEMRQIYDSLPARSRNRQIAQEITKRLGLQSTGVRVKLTDGKY